MDTLMEIGSRRPVQIRDREIAEAIEVLECYANRIIGCINNIKKPIGDDDWTDVSLNAYHNLEFDYQTFLIFIERYENSNIRVLSELLDKTVSSILALVNCNVLYHEVDLTERQGNE